MKYSPFSKLFSLTMAFVIGLTILQIPASAAGLTDILGHKNQTAIQWIYDRNIIAGYSDNTFLPDIEINRAEMMKILVEAKKVDLTSGEYKNCFPDVKEEWFAPYVCYAKEQNWVEGYPDSTFKPEKYITKEEAMKMLVNSRYGTALDIPEPAPKLFSDLITTEWYYPYIYTAKEKAFLEQTGGAYGVGTFITRGEVAENIYRAMIVDENNLMKFTDYQPIPTVTNQNAQSTCEPVKGWGGISAEEGKMKVVKIPVCEGYRYTACTQDMVGNPDLYGGAASPTISQFDEKSTDDFIITKNDDETETKVPRPDCITFEPKATDYYLGILGAGEDSTTNIWMTASKLQNVPEGFEKSLVWFADECTELTNDKFGPFNTPWGNEEDSERPFYQDYANYVHGGADFACPADTEVKAMCDGVIADSNDAGEDWGWHTVLDCKNNDKTMSIVLIHLQQESVLPAGTPVKAGDIIGKVYPMDIPGEQEHIHLTGCKLPRAECEADGLHPERGASRRAEWWGASQLWFDMDWHTNPGLYKVLPEV